MSTDPTQSFMTCSIVLQATTASRSWEINLKSEVTNYLHFDGHSTAACTPQWHPRSPRPDFCHRQSPCTSHFCTPPPSQLSYLSLQPNECHH